MLFGLKNVALPNYFLGTREFMASLRKWRAYSCLFMIVWRCKVPKKSEKSVHCTWFSRKNSLKFISLTGIETCTHTLCSLRSQSVCLLMPPPYSPLLLVQLCTAAPSGRKITICEYGYTTSAMKSTYLHHAAICHHSKCRMNQILLYQH